jgi:hypothetical protein
LSEWNREWGREGDQKKLRREIKRDPREREVDWGRERPWESQRESETERERGRIERGREPEMTRGPTNPENPWPESLLSLSVILLLSSLSSRNWEKRNREAEIHGEPRTREAKPVIAAGKEGPRPDFRWVNGGSTVGCRRMHFPVRLEEISGDSLLDFRWIFSKILWVISCDFV